MKCNQTVLSSLTLSPLSPGTPLSPLTPPLPYKQKTINDTCTYHHMQPATQSRTTSPSSPPLPVGPLFPRSPKSPFSPLDPPLPTEPRRPYTRHKVVNGKAVLWGNYDICQAKYYVQRCEFSKLMLPPSLMHTRRFQLTASPLLPRDPWSPGEPSEP